MTGSFQFHTTVAGHRNHPPLLFLHGLMGSCADWEEIVPYFSDRFYCLALDLPGHGQTITPCKAAFEMERTAENFIDFLRGLGINRCNLVAYSMGGRLAFYLAATRPEMFDRIVIESASPGLADSNERELRINHDRALAQRCRSMGMERFVEQWYGQPLFSTLSRVRERFHLLVRRRVNGNTPDGVSLSLEKMGTGTAPSVWDRLDRITARLLLVVGEKDEKFRKIARAVAAACPRARVHVVEDAGHNVHFENPKAFVNQVRLFLRGDRCVQ